MNKPTTLAAALLGMITLLATGPLVLAANPPGTTTPIAESEPLRSGRIDSLDLSKGVVVIDDRQYLITDKLTVNGKSSGARYNLRQGMGITFTYGVENGRRVINDVKTGQ